MRSADKLFLMLLGWVLSLVLILAGQAMAQQGCLQPPSGLVGWWPGDGNANDIRGGNNGALQGAITFSPGEVDQAFNFDGSTRYIQVPQNSLWQFGSNDFTVDFWINFRTPNTSETLDSPDVFDIIGVDEGEGGTNKWLVRFGAGVVTLHVNDSGTGPGSLFLAQAPFSPELGRWYFIAITRSGNMFTTYIDGQAAAVETVPITIPFINAPLTWGLVEAGRYLDGLMDEVEIYNRGLSAAEIQAIFDAGSAGKCKTLNDFVTFEPIRSTYRFTGNTAGCPAGAVGIFSFDARLKNISDQLLTLLAAEVTTLTGGNVLQNADGGPAGVGARLTVLQQGGFADGILSVDEFVDVPFRICIQERQPFSLFVDVVGVAGSSVTQRVLPYLSPGYRFLVVPFGQGSGFQHLNFDDSQFAVVSAAFGTGDFCPLDSTVETAWPLDTDLLLRKTFPLPANASTVKVAVAIDNDVQVFINGHDISGGLQIHEFCAERDSFVFSVPESLLVFGGENLLAVRARDRGGISYVDVEIRADISPF